MRPSMHHFHLEKKPGRQRVDMLLQVRGKKRKVGGGELVAKPAFLPDKLQALLKGRKVAKISFGLKDEFHRHPYKRRGLGTRMAHALEEIAREKGFRALVAFITPSNKISVRLAEKLGYQHLPGSHYYFKKL